VGQLNQSQGRERGLRRRLDHHGATGGQGRAGFTGDHRGREVPRSDSCGHADWLLDHDQALVGLVAGDHVAIDALGFFGEPLNKGRGVDDFALGFGQRLTLFESHQATEVVLVFNQQFEPTAQLVGALLGGQRTPGRQGLVGGFDGTAGFRGAHLWHGTENLARGRVVDLDGLTIVRIDPSAIDKGLLAEQLGIFKLHVGFP